MSRTEFQARLDRAKGLFIQEIRDGCLDCPQKGGLCRVHEGLALAAITDPRSCPEFQDFLKQLGFIGVVKERT